MKKFFVVLIFVLAIAIGAYAFTVTFVTDTGGIGDKSFNDSAWAGVEMAVHNLGVTANLIQSYEQADYISNLSAAAQVSNVVVAVGFLIQDAVKKVAPQFPNTKFVFIDGSINDIPNVESYIFAQQEGGFLVGYIAAAMTKTEKVGIVAGMPIPPVESYLYGFESGVETYNVVHGKNVQVISGYVGSFDDPTAGKAMTESEIAAGADIVYQLAGLSGLGVIDAMKDKPSGYFAIGADMDQDYLAPGHVLVSSIKRVDVGVYDGIKSALDGTFKGGETITLSIANGGIGISPMTYTKQLIPAHVMKEVELLKQIIKDGKINIPQTKKEFENFQVPSDVLNTLSQISSH